ncbi:MAG: amidohydrolase family protein [Vicinamibacterales bacterium]
MKRRILLPVIGLLAVGLAVTDAVGPTLRSGDQGDQATTPPPQGQPGQLRPRPGTGREPEVPPPSIVDYKPRTTLVVPEHKVTRAKFPVVDVHGHPPAFNSPEAVKNVVNLMSPLNIQVMVQTNGATGEALVERIAAIEASGLKDRVVMFSTVSFRDVGPGWGARAAQQLEADVKAGARGVGEIGKNLGLGTLKADGTRLKVDDPELDPFWAAAARLKVPIFLHLGEPQEFFEPLDYTNERWLEMALYANRRFNDRSRYPTFDELMAERDRMLAKHPKTTFILAHMGWHANDLGRLGKMFDKWPNLHAEVGAVLYDLGRQPRFGHDFFVKYQDRILFGKDSFQPDEYPYFWRVFETADEYFDYYRDYHAFWKLYGMNLPDPVLKKLYYQNALRIVPGLPTAGFPK